MWPVLGIVAVYARELLLARTFWCQNFRILEQLPFDWLRSSVDRWLPFSGMSEARRHSRSPEPRPRPPGREAPGSGSGPDGRRQRARRSAAVSQPPVAAAAADDGDEGFEIDDGMGALRRRGRRGRRENRAARAAARARSGP